MNAAGLSTNEVLNLLNNGADVNLRSRLTFGWTPLIAAIYHYKEDNVDILLARGANVNLGDGQKRTALHWAVQYSEDNTNLLLKMVKHGGNPLIKDNMGVNAFDMARSMRNSDELIAILEKSGIKDPSASNLQK